MPPPSLGRLPYGDEGPSPFAEEDAWGWRITEYEEAFELRPGLEQVARQVIDALVRLARGQPGHGIARSLTRDNPCWPRELAEEGGTPEHERYVLIAPLALSRTQDDKGRVRWTLFGGSEQGPARPFWRSYFDAPDRERPADEGPAFIRSLLRVAFGETAEQAGNLRRAGFRVLLQGEPGPSWPYGDEGPLPSWVGPYHWDGATRPRGLRYLLTFRPFAMLPRSVREAYLAGELHLLPTPGSLLFWGAPPYHRLGLELPMATQIPLLSTVARH